MPTPQTQEWSDPSSFLTTGHTPLIVTGWMVQLIRYQFGDPNNIENKQLRDNVWTPDVETTHILIEWVWDNTVKELARRPAILVKDNGVKPINIGFDSGRTGGDPHGSELTGSESYTVPIVGSHTVFALGREGGEAQLLATEVRRYIMQFISKIRNDLHLIRLQWLGSGPVAHVEEYREHYMVPITFGYAYWEYFELTPEAPILKTVKFDNALS